MARIKFNAWGRGRWQVPRYAVGMDDDNRPAIVAAAIARKNGWQSISIRLDGHDGRGNYIYQATLGRPCRGGGWTPEAEVWFGIGGQ